MFGSQFMLKTMIAIFSLPLVANANIHVNLEPLKHVAAAYEPAAGVDTAQLKQAAEAIHTLAAVNAQSTEQDPQLAKLMQNINTMLEQQQAH